MCMCVSIATLLTSELFTEERCWVAGIKEPPIVGMFSMVSESAHFLKVVICLKTHF